MRSATCVVRRWAVFASIPLVGALLSAMFAAHAAALTIDVALNVRYTVAGDVNSGGTWRLVAKSSPDTFGIAGMQINLTAASITGTPHAAGPIGEVNGNHEAGFSIFETATIANQKLLVIGQQGRVAPLGAGQEQSVFYGVGTLANGAPNFPGKPPGTNSIGPAFTTLSDTVRIPWATSVDSLNDAFWSTAAGLATGSFAPGATPGIISGSANVYTSLGTSQTLGTLANVTGANFISHGLRVVMGLGGDYNNNGIVDAADYSVWRNHLGQSFQLVNEGPDTPGQVTVEDYNFWKANFGSGAPGAGSGSANGGSPGGLGAGAVPEPGALALWLGAFGAIFLRTNRSISRLFRGV